jgi:hypothetical protein
MANDELQKTCNSCGYTGTENYCSRCGQPYITKRISMSRLLHDIFHLFTHLDKGFGYTLKKLALKPGQMQKEYIEGKRSKHQKPFSMFFICATVAALTRYWIFQLLLKYYDSGDVSELHFVHEYMVILNIILLPLHVIIVYSLFYKSGYNFGEIGVLLLYSISFLFVIATLVAFLKFFWPELDTAYIEFPILLIYNTITFLNFFQNQKRWIVVIKSLIFVSAVFLLIQFIEDFVISLI